MSKLKKVIIAVGAPVLLLLFGSPPGLAANWFKLQGTEPPDAKTVKICGFIQPTYYNSASDVLPDDDFRKNDFDIRRARLAARGIVPGTHDRLNYLLMAGFGRNGTCEDPNGEQSNEVVTTDASVTLNYIKYAHIRLGQFKLPIGNDALQSIKLHSYIEFSDVYAELLCERYGHDRSVAAFRDIGAQLFGWRRFGMNREYEAAYAFMVGNGNGINSRDNNDNKRVTTKVTLSRIFDNTGGAFQQCLELGGWYMTGKQSGFTVAPGPVNGAPVEQQAKRGGIELVAIKDLGKSGSMHFIGESVWASGWVYAPHFFEGAVPDNIRYYTENTSVDGHGMPHADLRAFGFYLDGGYRPPVLDKKIEADLRYSYYNPDSGDDLETSVAQDTWTLGAQYIFDEHARFIVNYEIRNNDWNSGIGNRFMAQVTAIF
ncbi:MAG: porin [Candidatus Zixiibacteriota bacterium]|jgi:hypothetical protein